MCVCQRQTNPCYGMIMSLEERRKQKLIKKEGEALTLSVSGSTGAAIDHNYRSEEGTPLHYLREEVGRSRRHRGGGRS